MRSSHQPVRALVLLVPLLCGCRGEALRARAELRDPGVLRVGTTGDYRPFSYLDSAGRLRGLDVEVALVLGRALGVRVRFVRTTWAQLTEGLEQHRFDIAMGGISKTATRARRVAFTRAYLPGGKCLLVRRDDAARFRRLSDVDRVGVRVAVNPGGTNERFVRRHVRRAVLLVEPDNRAIPELIASGVADAMITDVVEAVDAARRDRHLHAVDPAHPLVAGEPYAYALPRESGVLRRWIDNWLEQRAGDPGWQQLLARWISKGRGR